MTCVEALLNYSQADHDGIFVAVSRQAIHETVAQLAAVTAERDEALGLLGKVNEAIVLAVGAVHKKYFGCDDEAAVLNQRVADVTEEIAAVLRAADATTGEE